MGQVYVKLEKDGERACFVLETSKNAEQVDRSFLRPFIAPGVLLTCLHKEGATKYGWAAEAEETL